MISFNGRPAPGFALGGFALGANTPPKMYDQTTKLIDARTGDSFLVTLPGNPTTGYEWVLDSAPSAEVTVSKPTYAADPGCVFPCVGGGGAYTFAITAATPGSTTLHFVYRRAWETAAPPANELSIVVNVSADTPSPLPSPTPAATSSAWPKILIPAGVLTLVAVGSIWYIAR